MSDAKHTPGPWRIVHDELSSRLEFKGVAVAEAHQTRDYIDVDERHANARLIAAAPELLTAARASLRIWEDEEDSVKEEHADIIAALRAAITKAECTK